MNQKTKIIIEDDNSTSPAIQAETSPATFATLDEIQAAESQDADLNAKLQTAEDQTKDYYDRLLRVSADFENYRKRTAREMSDIRRYANEELLREFLTIVDNLERAITATAGGHPEDPLLKGVSLTLSEFQRLLEKHNVSPIEALGEPFDPRFHQAMLQEESMSQPPNTVLREFQKGYLIHDRLLRPAMVVVAKAGGGRNET